MSGHRSGRGNPFAPQSGKRTSYGSGSKTASWSVPGGRRHDTYWGGKGRPDGPGHGHRVRVGGYGGKSLTTYKRNPGQSRKQSYGLLDALFGVTPPKRKRR